MGFGKGVEFGGGGNARRINNKIIETPPVDGEGLVYNSATETWENAAVLVGSVAHADTTGQTADDHHAQIHAASHQDGGGDEISVTGLSGKLADNQYADNIAIIKPAGPAGGNVYTTWADAHAAVASKPGLRYIQLDGSYTITGPATYDMTGIIPIGTQFFYSILTIGEGVQLNNLLETGNWLIVANDSTTAAFQISDSVIQTTGSGNFFFDPTPKGPLYEITGGGSITLYVGLFTNIGDGDYPVIDVDATSECRVSAVGAGANLKDKAISGAVGALLEIDQNAPGASMSATHPSFLGTIVLKDVGDGAAAIQVDDSGFGAPTADNLQEFADAVFPIPTFEAVKPDLTSGEPAVHAEGQRYYDSVAETWVQQTSDPTVNRQEGEELWVPLAKNDSGADIDNGEVVYVSGASNGNPEITCAKADSASTSDATIGVATQEIIDTAFGRVTGFGVVRGLNTNSWAPGTTLYLSPSVAGAMTSTRPVAPNRTIVIGTVLVQSATVGSILVSIEKESRVVNSKGLYHSNPPNGAFNVLDHYTHVVTGQALSSAASYTPAGPFFNSQANINVIGGVGLPFTLRITGESVNEDAGTTTPADTENIAVAANGDYASNKKWLDAPTFSIVEGSKSCTIDVYRCRYWDNNNNNYRLVGSKWQFRPGAASWAFTYTIRKINTDGSSTVIETKTFASTDSPPWAANGEDGTWKRTDYNTDVDGSGKEGIVVELSAITSMAFIGADLRTVAI
jgi:hypothetical protein